MQQRGAIARLRAQTRSGHIIRARMGATEIRFDARDLEDGATFADLQVGQTVEFALVYAASGPRALQVRVLDE